MNASTHAENAANDIAAHLHPFTNLATHPQLGPLVIQRGDGIFVEDDQGRRYLEAMSGLWCASLGFSNARLAKAGSEALHGLPYYHTFNGRSNPAAIALAEKLLALAPVPMSKVFFANSGSEANDSAVKLVWYYHNAIGKPEKKKIIARRNAYHGVTVAAASLSGLVPNHRDFDLPIDRILHVDCPHHFRYAEAGESEEDFATRLAAALEQRILDEGPGTVGAFIAEPVMGAGGVLVPPATYFDKVQKVLAKYEVLLIADEVICGFGRTGQMFGSATFGLRPDILTAAKALSSGYVPISAVMVSEKVHAAVAANSGKIGTFGHGFTYSGHPVACAIALETLKVYEDENILAHVQSLVPQFQQGLQAHAARRYVGEVRGVGLIGAIELYADPARRTPFDPAQKAGARLAELALAQGLIVRAMGDSIAFCPPLIITAEQVDDMFARFGRAMAIFEESFA
ncbi:aminotransferase class III-fold pyridoxal phosphate-dependent enzyme [Variovorax beijingensis]|uniref:Aminotransferase class III-fold pyridoxal phosphate-dependent enzyme n=1 Tax=Variovorax beijingensis TaxID=2496117 RepID=A0A3P3EQP4_9BURK|nr:aminotransferase [Variovorax beijingensis]RRH88102.1 aminotransferase class III-fold pyridoxal phosphate-dependent enzyme [Variovorax beijingensis]RSZ37489.1 aminotransferase class III-fold pyridoxal phosphate-dependent enzyme [Variovorax beijingensis]